MTINSDFTCDGEFMKLLTRRNDVDLTVAALELARDAYPDLDFNATFDWIEARAEEVSGPVAQARDDRLALAELGNCLAGVHGIFGDRESYDHADSSYLSRVVERRRGIPISLSVLYMAVAERVGLNLLGVSAPGHFLTRYESVEGPLFLDAFACGKVLTFEECLLQVQTTAGLTYPISESALEPVSARSIIVRMLNNLKALHTRQKKWDAAWLVQHRLTALQPTVYTERRDLALISLKSNRPGMALDLFEACLRHCPSDESEILQQHAAEARRQIVRWN